MDIWHLEIEKGVDWIMCRPAKGVYDLLGNMRLIDTGMSERHLKEWKEDLSGYLNEKIRLVVYIESRPIYDLKKQGLKPKEEFETTIAGALEYLFENRGRLGFLAVF
jgi:hypothetical protein